MLKDELGYDYKNKDTSNIRNLYYQISRDREGKYDPKVIKKFENDISSIEDKILSIAY